MRLRKGGEVFEGVQILGEGHHYVECVVSWRRLHDPSAPASEIAGTEDAVEGIDPEVFSEEEHTGALIETLLVMWCAMAPWALT